MNRRWLGHVEEASGRRGHVKDVLDRTWGQVVDDLANAYETKQEPIKSNGDAHWYYGGWQYEPLTGTGHSKGQNGC